MLYWIALCVLPKKMIITGQYHSCFSYRIVKCITGFHTIMDKLIIATIEYDSSWFSFRIIICGAIHHPIQL